MDAGCDVPNSDFIMSMFQFTFSSTAAEPPTSSQVRFDNVDYTLVSKLWIRYTTDDGIDVYYALMNVIEGTEIYVQDKNNHLQVVQFHTLGTSIDKSTYVEIPVSFVQSGGAALSNSQAVLVNMVTQTGVSPEPPIVGGIDTTPAGPSANSYASVSEADAYNATRPFAASWASLTTDQKEGALKWAAVLLDSTFAWTGTATTMEQTLCWPRSGMLTRNRFPIDPMTLPSELKMAQIEYARQLSVADLTATNDAAAQGIASVGAGSVSVSFKNSGAAETIALQSSAYAYLSKNVPDAVRLLLVPSWYTQHPVLISDARAAGGVVFEIFR